MVENQSLANLKFYFYFRQCISARFQLVWCLKNTLGEKKYIPCITNSNNFISSVNKSATKGSSDEQIRASILLVLYFEFSWRGGEDESD